MDLSDALGGWPSDGNNQSGGGGPWPGQGGNPAWPGQPSGPGGGGGGAWPGGPSGPGGGGGGAWPGGPSGPGGGGGAWPGGPSGPGGGGGAWPGGPSGPGGGGAWPQANPGQPTWPSPSPNPSAPGGWPSPSPGPGPGSGPTFPAGAQQKLSVPYNQSLPSGAYDKMVITIAGTVNHKPDKITVDLLASDDIAFHLNARFNEGGKQVIVRNSCIGKKWGKEERDPCPFPFLPGRSFEIKIMCTNREFKVAVNGSHLLEFKHRITNLRSINQFNIYYDLSLTKVDVQKLP